MPALVRGGNGTPAASRACQKHSVMERIKSSTIVAEAVVQGLPLFKPP